MRRRPSELVEAILAAGLLIAVPMVLVATTGSPLPEGVRHLAGAARVATVACWLAWAWCTIGVLVSVVQRVRTGEPGVGATRHGLDALAARLAAIVLSVSSLLGVGAAAGAALPPAATTTSVVTQATSLSVGSPATSLPPMPHDVSPNDDVTAGTPSQTYVVQAGDCLWGIAERFYGDGEAWNQIAAANLGRTMDDGLIFLDPSLILVGWTFEIPATSPPMPAEPPAQPTESTAVGTPSPLRAPNPGGAGAVPPHAPWSRVDSVQPTADRSRAIDEARLPANEAMVVVGGLGSGLALLGLLRRRRRRADRLDPQQDDALVDAEVGLALLDPIPVITALEGAILLAAADGALGGIGIMRIDSHGATFFVEGRARWIAAGSELLREPPVAMEAPGLCLPLGEAEGTTWALVVPRGDRMILGGPQADRLLADVLPLQTELVWGSMVSIAENGDDAVRMSSLGERGSITVLAGPAGRHHKMLAGSGVVLIEADSSTDHDITVGDDDVTIRSLGVSCVANHLGAVAEALLTIPVEAPDQDPVSERDRFSDVAAACRHEGGAACRDLRDKGASSTVRLLVATPRVEGLATPIDPKRERRATELLAYLTLHHPDPTTGDRLRTRVLGSSTADAAAKTLFNVASAARRALGLDHEGTALLPPASRDGVYRISGAVTCDVTLFAEHLTVARHAPSAEVAMAHLRAGLELIEAEPLATVLAGYEWFTAEGHAARLEAQVEEAACLLVDLALTAGLHSLAEWALARSTLVIPHSETLAATAMEAAAATGSPDSLRRAFDHLRELVDSLEPGSWPLATHEARYAELRRGVVA